MFNFLKKNNPTGTKLSLAIDGMHCSSCSMSIDGELEDLEGVIAATTSYAKQKTDVEFDESKVNKSQIKKIITDLGYKVK